MEPIGPLPRRDPAGAVEQVLGRPRIREALILPYSGHASRQSLEIYSRLAIAAAQAAYGDAMRRFPV
jgi:integrase/recombinase XerD